MCSTPISRHVYSFPNYRRILKPPPAMQQTQAGTTTSGAPDLDQASGVAPDAAALRLSVDGMVRRLDEMEKQVREVSRFFAGKRREQQASGARLMPKEKPGVHQRDGDGARKDGACSKRMVELMRQYGTILRNMSQHKYSWPFMDPVDVEGLKLDDYNEIIKRPMDLGTIKKRMEAKDGTGYKNVRDIHSDVRLVFTNAMTYNSETHDVHQMAKVMLDKFEEKWQLLLPKVVEEENRQKEEAQTHVDLQDSHRVSFARMARETNNELTELDLELDKLKWTVIRKCRKISTEEKRKIAAAFAVLPPEEICKALDVIGQLNPNFSARGQNIELDIDALDEPTLWSLKFHIDSMLKQRTKNSVILSEDDNTKRRKEICSALAKAAKNRGKKLAES